MATVQAALGAEDRFPDVAAFQITWRTTVLV